MKTAQNILNCISNEQKTTAHWLELVGIVLAYKFPQLSPKEIQEMLGYNDIELKQTRFYQDVFTEGLQEGEAKIILNLLNRRLGNLNPKTSIQIQKLNSIQLEALGNILLDFTTQNDLDTWLRKSW